MGDHVAQLESKIAKLMAMGSGFDEAMKVAILLSSLAEQYKLAPIVLSVDTSSEDKETWSYVSGIFFEEDSRL